MAYASQADFNAYSSVSIPAEDLADLLERASDVVDMLTLQRIPTKGFTTYPSATQAAIKKATCAEVETLWAQGGLDALNGNASSSKGGFTIGKYSEGASPVSAGSNIRQVNGIPISPLIDGYLLMTGLLYCGISKWGE